jgi:putative ABC transport system permease protein
VGGKRREPAWRRYSRLLRTDIARDVDEELAFHLEMSARDFEARGMTPADARRAAEERFGDPGRVAGWLRRHDHAQERARRARETMSTIGQNLRAGVRSLVRQPTFTAAAVLTLALGIGGTTAMFSVVYGVVLRPLPFGEPERLVRLWTAWQTSLGRGAVSSANAVDWRTQNRVFEDIAIIRNGNYSLTGLGEPERLNGARVWASFFSVLRASPQLGRPFTEAEEHAGRENVVVLSHALWVRRFSADRSIVGRTIRLNSVPTTVIGVMKPDFRYPTREVELWVPLVIPPGELALRTAGSYSAVARLKPGVTLQQAHDDMRRVSADLARTYPDNAQIGVGLAPLLDDMVGGVRRPLYVLLGAVGAMLLIGCANLTNLLLARGVGRRRELAVRTALGASRGRLIEQSISELVPLLAFGGVLGLLVATWVVRALVPLLPADLPRAESIAISLPVLGFTTVVVALVAFLVTIWPAVDAARSSVSLGLVELSRGSTSGPRRARLRDTLVVAQIAATLMLLVGATILMRSFAAVRQVSAGFIPENVLSAHVAIPRSKYPLDAEVVAFETRMLDRLRTLPGVVAVGMVNRLPLGGGNQTGGLQIEGTEPNADSPTIQTRSVSSEYFRALEIPFKEGRSFTSSDGPDAPNVAIIDAELAGRLWPGLSPIGRRVRAGDGPWSTIIGVVGHIRHSDLADESDPQVYWNYAQRIQDRMTLVVKTRGEPAALTQSIAAAIRELDPEQPIYDVRTLAEVIDRSLGQRWFQMMLLGVFATISLLLASIGTYGVIAFGVGQRLREFGVRIALGARRTDVIGMVLKRGGVLFALGAAAGLVLALATVRVLSTLVYGVTPRDTASFVAATLVLFAVSMAACYVPARRAARVDPSVALRSE